jgi:hypothetical protein
MSPKHVRASPKTKYPFGRYAHACALVGSRVYLFGGHRMQAPSMLMDDLSYIDLPTSPQGSLEDGNS